MKKTIETVRYPSLAAAFTLFAALIFNSGAAQKSALQGLSICAEVIIPSLFPFFIASSLLNNLGLPQLLGRFFTPLMSRLFGVSGEGASAFFIGISGGYPLGAATVAELVRSGCVTRDEGARLLGFCNNSGPAFIIGAVGVGVFGSAGIGLALYLIHVLAAVTTGLLMRGHKRGHFVHPSLLLETPSFAEAVSAAVKSSVSAILNICGFVVAFTVLAGLLESIGFFTVLAGELAIFSRLGLTFSSALLTGLLEIGSGIGAMRALAPTAPNLALAAFIIGWGSLSVHFQTLAVIGAAKISAARHTAGRLLSGVFSAIYAFLLFSRLL